MPQDSTPETPRLSDLDDTALRSYLDECNRPYVAVGIFRSWEGSLEPDQWLAFCEHGHLFVMNGVEIVHSFFPPTS